MKKSFFFFSLLMFFSAQSMERPRQRNKSESVFQSPEYAAFINCYFKGNDNPDNRTCYMNYRARDKMWSMYKTFIDNGGIEVIKIANSNASFSPDEFKLMKAKLFELQKGLGEACELLEKLEKDKEAQDGKMKIAF